MTVASPAAGLRLVFVLWDGGLGGAETYVAALARVLRASNVDARVLLVGEAEPLAERLGQAEVPFTALGFGRGRGALWHPRRFAEAARSAGPDGAVLPGTGFLAAALRLGGYGGRIVAVEHGSVLQTDPAHRRSGLVERLDEAIGARFIDAYVAVSDYLRRRMKRGPAVTIPNGVDLDVYRPSAGSAARDAFVIGCVSRLIPGKGVEDVLVAARPSISRGARLRVVGDGPERPKLEELAGRLGIRDAVSFEGWLGGAGEIVEFWGRCDVAIAAPNDWIESFGLGAVEAMACGRPVVATRVGGLADAVVDGRTGVLVEPRDTESLGAALIGYQEDESLLAAHGAAARAWCEERFDIRRCAAEYAGLFGAAE